MTEVIAIPEVTPHFTQRVSLDGTTYLLELQWVQRESFWYFRLATEQDVTVTGFRKLVVDWDLLHGVIGTLRPPGRLFFLDTSGVGAEAAFDDLGVRCLVCYRPQ
jgi:hypothetical protein